MIEEWCGSETNRMGTQGSRFQYHFEQAKSNLNGVAPVCTFYIQALFSVILNHRWMRESDWECERNSALWVLNKPTFGHTAKGQNTNSLFVLNSHTTFLISMFLILMHCCWLQKPDLQIMWVLSKLFWSSYCCTSQSGSSLIQGHEWCHCDNKLYSFDSNKTHLFRLYLHTVCGERKNHPFSFLFLFSLRQWFE